MKRRNFIRTGSAAFGTVSGAGISAKSVHAWNPGPYENLVRDLTPGPTPIRLGGYLRPLEGESPTEMVKQLRDDGSTGDQFKEAYAYIKGVAEKVGMKFYN